MREFILVVEDDEMIRESLCGLLEDEGHRVVGAANGKDALEILERGLRPCLIILDMVMPVMDGRAFRAEQMKDPRLATIPVAVMTASDEEAAASLGAEFLLHKPFRSAHVLEAVNRYCRARPVA
jgi:CheY-like chemotaxis protein